MNATKHTPAEAALAAALLDLKETSGYTVTSLSETLGIERSWLWRFLCGRTHPGPAILLAVQYNMPALTGYVAAVETEKRERALQRQDAVRAAVSATR